MKKLATMLLGAAALMAATACGDVQPARDFTLTVDVDTTLNAHTARLLVLEKEYDRMRELGSDTLAGGTATLSGQIAEDYLACLRLGGRDVLFVLGPGHTGVRVGKDRLVVTGGAANHRYMTLVQRMEHLKRARARLDAQRQALQADTTRRARATRRELETTDSLACDVMQRLAVAAINRHDAVGRIVADRYAATLDSAHRRQLK